MLNHPIINEIENDFKEYPDLRKIEIIIKKAIDNDNQFQFSDTFHFKYTYGEYNGKRNNPLSPRDSRAVIDVISGHVIYNFTSLDRLLKKQKNQENSAEVFIQYTSHPNEYTTYQLDFEETKKFILKYVELYLNEYPQLKPCVEMNYRGIFDIDNNVPPVIGFIQDVSADDLTYTYPYRDNENPVLLRQYFSKKTRQDIDSKLKTRNDLLYRPINKQTSRDLLKIEHTISDMLKPVEKYCSSMFGVQKYSLEHNDNKITITYMISDIEKFKETFNAIFFPPEYIININFSDNTGSFVWGTVTVIY